MIVDQPSGDIQQLQLTAAQTMWSWAVGTATVAAAIYPRDTGLSRTGPGSTGLSRTGPGSTGLSRTGPGSATLTEKQA